jgi:hypothetical protein
MKIKTAGHAGKIGGTRGQRKYIPAGFATDR